MALVAYGSGSETDSDNDNEGQKANMVSKNLSYCFHIFSIDKLHIPGSKPIT